MSNIAIQNKIDRDSFSTLRDNDWLELRRRLSLLVEALYYMAEQTSGTQLQSQKIIYYADQEPVDVTAPEGEIPPAGRINGVLYVVNPDGSTREINVVNGWLT